MSDARTRRLRALAAMLREEPLASQSEARARLGTLGFSATQATVSRDLDRLGAVKAKRGGRLVYCMPEAVGGADWAADRLERIVGEWALSAEAAGTMVVVRTPPGSAHLVASAIDTARLPEVAGTVSGDDTLFVAVRDGHPPDLLAGRFKAAIGVERVNGPPPPPTFGGRSPSPSRGGSQ